MATKAKTKSTAAKGTAASTAAKGGAKAPEETPTGKTATGAATPETIASQHKVVTSTSSGPGAVPIAEVAGAGADRAAGRAALRIEGGLVQNEAGRLNKVAEVKTSTSLEEALDSLEVGTTIEKTGRGIVIHSPIGGGARRTFAGLTTKDALEQMSAFFTEGPALMQPLTPEGEKQAKAAKSEKAEK